MTASVSKQRVFVPIVATGLEITKQRVFVPIYDSSMNLPENTRRRGFMNFSP